MEKEGKDPKKQAHTNYWIEALLGFGATTLLYTIVKVARKEKPTVKGAVASGMAGTIGTPLAIWGVPKLIEMEKQAQAPSSFRQVTTASYPQLLAGSTAEQESTAQVDRSVSSSREALPAPPVKQDNPNRYPPSKVPSPIHPDPSMKENIMQTIHWELEKLKRKLSAGRCGLGVTQENLDRKDTINQTSNVWLKILKPGSIILITGRRGSGKTSAGHKMLEYTKLRGPCYIVGFPREAQKELPPWVGVISEIREAPPGATILLDEGPLLFSSKESMSQRNQKLLSDMILARQRGHTLIIITQDSSYIDKNVLRSIDTLIIKEPAPLQVKMDRPEIRTFLEKAARAFNQIEHDKRDFCYVAFSPSQFTGMIPIPKASYWNEKLSKAYASGVDLGLKRAAKTLTRAEKIKLAWEHHKEGKSAREIAIELGVSKSTVWNWIQQHKREHAEALRLFFQQFPSLDTQGKNEQKALEM